MEVRGSIAQRSDDNGECEIKHEAPVNNVYIQPDAKGIRESLGEAAVVTTPAQRKRKGSRRSARKPSVPVRSERKPPR